MNRLHNHFFKFFLFPGRGSPPKVGNAEVGLSLRFMGLLKSNLSPSPALTFCGCLSGGTVEGIGTPESTSFSQILNLSNTCLYRAFFTKSVDIYFMRLITLIDVCHSDRYGNIIWQDNNFGNILHTQGREYILKSMFVRSTGVIIPTAYYVGLDNRTTVNQSDILANITGEPTQFGYARQTLSSQNGFGAIFDTANWKAKSTTLLYHSVGGAWGPIRNAFLTTGSAMNGFLISTMSFNNPKTINNGENFSFKMIISLED